MTKKLLIEYGTMVSCISCMNFELTIPCFVSFARVNSELFKRSQGVGQGRMFSALMFLVYINELFMNYVNLPMVY